MPTKKQRPGRREYGVEDETGTMLRDPSGTTRGAARIAATRLATERGESVYVIEVGRDSDGTRIVVDREEIKPPAEPPRSRAQIKREVDAILAKEPVGVLGSGSKSEDDSKITRAREISERRLAALIANGEDIRNSPAWRDAVSESRMIGLMSRLNADPTLLSGSPSKHTRVEIRWYAIPNQNKASGGFLPMIEEDGRPRSDTWATRGYDKAQAEVMAEEKAHDAASRFIGDWNVVVKKGRPARL